MKKHLAMRLVKRKATTPKQGKPAMPFTINYLEPVLVQWSCDKCGESFYQTVILTQAIDLAASIFYKNLQDHLNAELKTKRHVTPVFQEGSETPGGYANCGEFIVTRVWKQIQLPEEN